MISKIFTIVLGGASIYFFYEYNFFLGILFLVWFISRLLGYNLQRLIKGFGEITTHSNLEKKCNCLLELKINIEEVLKHPTIDKLFDKLQKNKIIAPSVQKENWIKKMIDNYKKKFGNKDIFETVKFNIKNNFVWKNGEIDFNDSIYYEIFIPYEYKDGEEYKEKSIFTPEIEAGITIRVFIVNGIIKLQVGDFSKEYTPNIIRDGALAVYQTHETITSFPLIYFSYQHKIPENYLNLSAYATESWKNFHAEKNKRSKDFTFDWKELNKEIRDYNYVCSVADEYVEDKGKWGKIVKIFEEKKEQWLKKENFKNPFAREYDGDYYDDLKSNNVYFINKYLSIFVANYNDLKEKREKYAYIDYYEEKP